MTIPNASRVPRLWTDVDLKEAVQRSIDVFVARRLAEPRDRYLAHIRQRQKGILALFRTLAGVDPTNPDPVQVRNVLFDRDMFDALRYVAGPPVSEHDLSVLVNRSTASLSKGRLRQDDEHVKDVLRLICILADPIRFPWIGYRRPPHSHELKTAIRATVAMHAAQSLQTERRGYGREIERRLRTLLEASSFVCVPAPNGGFVKAPRDHPPAFRFYGETTVYGRKADLFVGLPDGRSVAVEAKDSSSALNSVKRVLNDTAAKARHWEREAGKNIVPVALLSGVFKLESLLTAQGGGLYLVWADDISNFADWLLSQ